MADRDDTSVFDERQALEFAGDDRGLLLEVAQMVLAEGPGRMKAMREAFARGDREAMERLAHKLRGSLGSLAAAEAVGAAQNVETAAVEDDLPRLGLAIDALEGALGSLFPVVERFVASAATEP